MSGKFTMKFSDPDNEFQHDVEATVGIVHDGPHEFVDALIAFMQMIGFAKGTVDYAVEVAAENQQDRLVEVQKGSSAGPFDSDGPVLECIQLSDPVTEEDTEAVIGMLQNASQDGYARA